MSCLLRPPPVLTSEARVALARDTKVLLSSVSSGIGPGEVVRAVVVSLIRRTSSCPPQVHAMARAAASTRVTAATQSDLLARRITLVLGSIRGVVEPEVESGLLLYAVGDPKQHGLGVVGLQVLAESSGVEAASRLKGYRDARLADLASRDVELMSFVDALPGPVQRSVRGALDEAKVLLSEGDERSASSFFATARRLIRRWQAPGS